MRQALQTSWAVARETGVSVLTYQLYPLGMFGESTPKIPARRQNYKQVRPMIFLHGILHNRSTFLFLIQRLARRGVGQVYELNLMTTLYSIPKLAEQLATTVEEVRRKHRARQVDIVAHSLGGIVSRWYLQQMGGDGKVANLFTLGTPHGGCDVSRLAFFFPARDLNPTSALMHKLKQAPPPQNTRVVAIRGNLDIFTRRNDQGFWPGVKNLQLAGLGHAGLLFSKRVADIICAHSC